MSGIVFDAMFGAKKLGKYLPVINCLTLAGEPSHLKARKLLLFARIFIIYTMIKSYGSWRLVYRSWANDCGYKARINYGYKVNQLFDARHGIKKRCQTLYRVTLVLIYRCHVWHRFLMSGVKKQPNFIPAIICPTSANESSYVVILQ